MDGLVKQGERAGVVTIVSRDGHIVQLGEYGSRDIANKKPMRADTIVRAYGLTEPVTAVAVMILYEEGRLQLDDPVQRYVPQLAGLQVLQRQSDGKLRRVAPKRPVTIRHLLTHTSGLSYNYPASVLYKRDVVFSQNQTLADMMSHLAKLPLLHQPGDGWTHGPSYDVLARLVEVVSEQTFDQFLEQRIFRPLSMADTGFRVPVEKRDRFSEVYTSGAQNALTVVTKTAPRSGPYDTNGKLLSGAQGLVTTALDYWSFAQMLANRGEFDNVRILSPSTVALMLREQIAPNSPPPTFTAAAGQEALVGHSFGLGFALLMSPDRYGVAGSPGIARRSGLANTTFWIDPDKKIVAVLMSQYLPKSPSRIERDYQALVYQALID
jgi:CubicO group peptidase (beta-lactamase class C family)